MISKVCHCFACLFVLGALWLHLIHDHACAEFWLEFGIFLAVLASNFKEK